jgi:hypothetical protein
MIEWKPNEPEAGQDAPQSVTPAADFITINDDIPLRDLLDDAIAIKTRRDERAEGRSHGR